MPLIRDELFEGRPRCVAVVSTGGGGDPGSAAYLAEAFRREGVNSILVVLPWERFVRDPCPGPLPASSFAHAAWRGEYTVLLQPGCWAQRCGRVLRPAACSVASAAPWLPVYIVDGWLGELGVRLGLLEAASLHGCEAVVAFDVGGDMVATGLEEEVWSPLADALGLAAAAYSGLEAVAAVHSPGADGELSAQQVLRQASRIARRGGYLWARGLDRFDVEFLEHMLSHVYTEAGRVAVLAAKGFTGRHRLRGGTRLVEVTLLQALTIFLDARTAAEESAARHVAGTSSLAEAWRRLREAGICTELDLEIGVSLFTARYGRLPSGRELLAIRDSCRLGRD